MNTMQALIDSLCEKALHPADTIHAACLESGRKPVGLFPIYTPEELVYAAGFLPVGMWGGDTDIRLADRYLQGFCCSIMRTNIEYGMRGTYDTLAAVLIPTLCDTLKCICENWKVAVPQVPVIPVVYPQNRNLPAGVQYLKDEFRRVLAELEKLAGHPVRSETLEAAFTAYEDCRAAMRNFCDAAASHPKTINAKVRHLILKASYFMEKPVYTRQLQELTQALLAAPTETCAVRAIATGLLAEPLGVLDIFVDNDIAIVGDDLAQESRQFRTPARTEGDAISRMAWRIMDQKGCAFLYEPEKTRGQMLLDLAAQHQAKAVIALQMKFCDPEEYDYPIYKAELEKAGMPLLYLEVEEQMDSFGQLRTRVQSFTEMLS